ncbi:hypothetical protein BDE40_1255 [Litoreibacter halocynthiae]|uniref:Uncharacterized protein n=1 Tax=Litoreibacter halocynthiae TaxID=1242689 RepID=A0A4R7LQ64_9RHOB|nr:hypothetical protein BDE40_1255 [Litoreibacter halocynthiae]
MWHEDRPHQIGLRMGKSFFLRFTYDTYYWGRANRILLSRSYMSPPTRALTNTIKLPLGHAMLRCLYFETKKLFIKINAKVSLQEA